ncbi:MAG: hypothetical protein ACLUW6_10300 [Coriobacteriaceae bacterium]
MASSAAGSPRLPAAATVVGRIKGVKRPALGQVIPAWARPTLLIDGGPRRLQAGVLAVRPDGRGVHERHHGVETRRSVSEHRRGDTRRPVAQEAHRLLTEAVPPAGNCGGRPHGGRLRRGGHRRFTGNVWLKTTDARPRRSCGT